MKKHVRPSLAILFTTLLFLTGCAAWNKTIVNNQWNYVSQKDLQDQGAILLGAEAYPSKWGFRGIFECLETGKIHTLSAGGGGPGIRTLDPGSYSLKKMILTELVRNAKIEIPVWSNSVTVKRGTVTYVGDFIFTLGEAGSADLNDAFHWVGAAMGVFEKPVQVRWRIVSKSAERKKELRTHWGSDAFSFTEGLLQAESTS